MPGGSVECGEPDRGDGCVVACRLGGRLTRVFRAVHSTSARAIASKSSPASRARGRTFLGRAGRAGAGLGAVLAVMAPVVVTGAAPAAADTIAAPCTTPWVSFGSAACTGSALRLTTSGRTHQAGLSIDTTAVSTANPITITFDATLVQQPKGARYGANGIAVGLYNAAKPLPTSAKKSGGDLGINGLPVAAVSADSNRVAW